MLTVPELREYEVIEFLLHQDMLKNYHISKNFVHVFSSRSTTLFATCETSLFINQLSVIRIQNILFDIYIYLIYKICLQFIKD